MKLVDKVKLQRKEVYFQLIGLLKARIIQYTIINDEFIEDAVVNIAFIIKESKSTLSVREQFVWADYVSKGIRQHKRSEIYGESKEQISKIIAKIETKTTI